MLNAVRRAVQRMRFGFLQRTALLAGAIALLTLVMLTAAYGQAASPADLTGNWQGTMQSDPAQRILLQITRIGDGGAKPA